MLTISDDILNVTGLSAQELLQEMAIYLYVKEKLSFGQAKKLSGLNIFQFQELLYNNNVPNHYGITELEEDFESIQNFKEK
jgi:predicted HTH domain antitoxin